MVCFLMHFFFKFFSFIVLLYFVNLDEDGSRPASAAPAQAPIMGVAGEVMPSQDLINNLDSASIADSNEFAPSPPIYFRSFIFSPDVLIRFDYHGKGVIDLSQGPSLLGLLEGLIQINCSQLTLKRLSHRHG